MSGGSYQKTLFQTWGTSVPQNKHGQQRNDGKKKAGVCKPSTSNTAQVANSNHRNPLWTEIGQDANATNNLTTAEDSIPEFDDEDDDDLMVVAVYEAEKSLQLDHANLIKKDKLVNVEDTDLPSTSVCGQTYPDFPGFDSSSAKVWIYPTNYPIRDYQLKISEVALFQNTLVCLPTGLGKTFIASVVMYNFYRWYPTGKIVFMAPTKPLVAQQIEACYKVMGIPQEHMAELTGSTAAKQRGDVWRSKRVFFLTPQVMVNDLSRDTCPAKQVKCVVIDEAHKALGNHAYCQVIRQLTSQTLQFRVLALSATPGGDTKSVQCVISNLLISHIELRSDESLDIQAHSHQRSVEKVVVPLGEMLCSYQTRYLQVLEKFMSRLIQNRVMSHKDLRNLSKYQLILARDQFRKNPPPHIKGPQQGMLEGDFALCISLYHGYELLVQMGLRSIFFYFQGIMDGSREMPRAKNELQRTPTFMDFYLEMQGMFEKPPTGPDERFIYSHPKLEMLEEVVLRHFRAWAENSAANNGPEGVTTRVMIFSSFRESVQEIAAMLNRHSPLIRVMTFMGQASAGKVVKGFTQKEQLEVVQRFRHGGFNTLVSTCVGEEGLDIGEVDLIVCFDAQKNPIRLVQRMGRTGRKRQGRIIIILAEGKEERTYNQSQCNKRSMHKFITGNKNGFHMYPNSPRMLPQGVHPTLHKMHITCGQFDPKECNRRSMKGRRSLTEGRASLIHPQNLIQQWCAPSDGFLSSTEYSLWASTMKLRDDEPHPTLMQSHFLSIPDDSSPQVDISKDGPCRELSLWEWRHWQHKALPTHVVDHSLRCQHFSKVMKLIDGMKEENEGECRYEKELLPYLYNKGTKNSGPKKQQVTKIWGKSSNSKAKPSHSSRLELYSEDLEGKELKGDGLRSTPVAVEQLPVEHDDSPSRGDDTHPSKPEVASSPSITNDDNCVFIKATEENAVPGSSEMSSQVPDKNDNIFYLPKWDSPPLSINNMPDRSQRLMSIFTRVSEILSLSPPALDDRSELESFVPPSSPHQPFLVNFNLEVNDDDDEEMIIPADKEPEAHEEGDKSAQPIHSPTWEEVFEDEKVNCDHDSRKDDKKNNHLSSENLKMRINHESTSKESNDLTEAADGEVFEMEGSMDLFDDDEAFLQVTLPNVPTPPKLKDSEKTCNSGHHSTENHLTTLDNSASFNTSRPVFSVNFDLGYSLEDSEDEAEVEANPVELASTKKQQQTIVSPPAASTTSSTPHTNLNFESKLSTPQIQLKRLKTEELPSPITPQGVRRTLVHSLTALNSKPGNTRLNPKLNSLHVKSLNQELSGDSDEEVVVHKRKQPNRFNLLSSMEQSNITSDADSPMMVKRKRVPALQLFDETQQEVVSDDDFLDDSRFRCKRTSQPAKRKQVQPANHKNAERRKARQFLDEEAELSDDDEGADVSSDEEDGEDQNQSLEGFVVDNTHLTQGLNESEMRGVYLKSVRSPAVQGKFKMSYRNHHNMNVYSQIPEMDETYAEDSFVVGSDVEESCSNDEEVEDVELMPEDSDVDGRKQYATRRRVFLHKAKAARKNGAESPSGGKKAGKAKRTRVMRIDDSSEEEKEEASKKTSVITGDVEASRTPASVTTASKVSLLSKAQKNSMCKEKPNERCRQRLENDHLLSDELDFVEPGSSFSLKKHPEEFSSTSSVPQTSTAQTSPPASVCILVDGRCLSAGAELLTCLRQRHAATVHVCSLDSSYFIISNRMAVERFSQSDLATTQNRKRLVDRVNNLQELFECVCLIVEKDKSKPGETSRPFQRTRYYNSTLIALIRSGVRLLWSDNAEDSARLLVELAKLELRKSHGIAVPLEVKGHHRKLAFQFYSNLPSVSYVHALNLSHNFSSIAELISSPIEDIQKRGCMSRSRAEEIYRFLRYSYDSLLINLPKAGKTS